MKTDRSESLFLMAKDGYAPAIWAIAEINKLRSALQRISVLPLTKRGPTKPDPNVRARKIAIKALGGDPRKMKHFNQST